MDRGTYEVPLFGKDPIAFYRDRCQFILKSPRLLGWSEKVKCKNVFANPNVTNPSATAEGKGDLFT